MKNFKHALIGTLLLFGCENRPENLIIVQLEKEGVQMSIPKDWSIKETTLIDQDSVEIGGSEFGWTKPNKNEKSCANFLKKYKKEMDEQMEGFGGDVFYDNLKYASKKINGVNVHSVQSDVTAYSETEYKGTECLYCLELENKKLFFYAFYFENKSNHTFSKTDTIMSTVKLISQN